LKLAHDKSRQLLITLKKKNMWTTSADVHAFNTPVAARVFEFTRSWPSDLRDLACPTLLYNLLAYHVILMRLLLSNIRRTCHIAFCLSFLL
jgi:hypothetical protein